MFSISLKRSQLAMVHFLLAWGFGPGRDRGWFFRSCPSIFQPACQNWKSGNIV